MFEIKENKLSLSEHSFIDEIKEKFSKKGDENIICAIGDDCSVVEYDDENYLITSTDLLVEDTHFIRSEIAPEDLGWKSFAVTYSDLSAMGGGSPQSLYLSIGLPADMGSDYRQRLLEGMKSCVDTYGGTLLGGDTVKSEKITINILAQALISKHKLKLRSDAKAGDHLCLIRPIGNSELALKSMMSKREVPSVEIVKQAHYRPQILFDEINWLGDQSSVHGMIDLSDGLISEIKHICDASQCSADLDLSQIPLTSELTEYLKNNEDNDFSFCEEYTILFTVEESAFASLSQRFLKKYFCKLYSIGKLKERDNKNILNLINNNRVKFGLKSGFDHF